MTLDQHPTAQKLHARLSSALAEQDWADIFILACQAKPQTHVEIEA